MCVSLASHNHCAISTINCWPRPRTLPNERLGIAIATTSPSAVVKSSPSGFPSIQSPNPLVRCPSFVVPIDSRCKITLTLVPARKAAIAIKVCTFSPTSKTISTSTTLSAGILSLGTCWCFTSICSTALAAITAIVNGDGRYRCAGWGTMSRSPRLSVIFFRNPKLPNSWNAWVPLGQER